MGFGTLFIGYFLLLNIAYWSITDVIAAVLMLIGLYNLSSVNKYFKISAVIALVFSVFAAVEFYFAIADILFGAETAPMLLSIFSAVRFATLGTLGVLILLGIREVSIEVELEDMPIKCLSRAIMTSIVYGFGFILELPILHFLPDKTLYVMSAITVLVMLIIICMNLTVIYGAYMKICMPKDNITNEKTKIKKSRFAFVNEYRKRKTEKDKEEAEYRLKKLQELSQKQGGKKRK